MIPRSHLFLFLAAAFLVLLGLHSQYEPLIQVAKGKQGPKQDPSPDTLSRPSLGAPQKNAQQKPHGSTAKPSSYCKWVFDQYESSDYEEAWFQEVPGVQSTTREGPNICQAMQSQKHVEAATAIVGRAINLTAIDPKVQWDQLDEASIAIASLDPADEYMSRMHYRRVCYDEKTQSFQQAPGRGIQLIEPLFGMLRDPFDGYCGKDKLVMQGYPDEHPGQSKHHILPQGYSPFAYTTKDEEPKSWQTHGVPPWYSSLRPEHDEQVGTVWSPPQNVHLDLGSSYFGGWTASPMAASGQWFYDKYHVRGQKFTRFIAVEVETLNDTMAFEQIPADLVGIYTLMNIGLTMGEDKLNAIEMIKRLVRPEDFFVFKLDIDSAPIEELIVQSLLADDPDHGGASALVDELMFEHHVNFWPMNSPWGLAPTSKKDGDLLTSYNLFRELRKKGIRTHSWP